MPKLNPHIVIVMFISLLVTSCYYDNEEDLYPMSGCDTANVKYTQTIAPIMQNRCNGCHATGNQTGVVTETWEGLNAVAVDGRLWGAVNHESGYNPMPQNQDKLSDCDLSKISIWIEGGALNN